jgi:hypothetical protein
MSKKLLEESTIRSFMKLANLQPLSEKFISEKYMDEEKPKMEEGELEEEVQEEGEALEEEVVEEEGEAVAEGKESEGRPSSPKPKVKGVAKPGKMDAAKNAPKDAKLTPMKQTHVHSDKPDSIETKDHSTPRNKNNSQFEVVTEALEEEMEDEAADAPEMDAGEGDMGSAGETGDHQAKMKDLINNMLDTLKNMASEYGVDMEISRGAEGGEEAPAPEAPEAETAPAEEDEAMMEEKLDEMVEKLTKRVAARLVKESKKKR